MSKVIQGAPLHDAVGSVPVKCRRVGAFQGCTTFCKSTPVACGAVLQAHLCGTGTPYVRSLQTSQTPTMHQRYTTRANGSYLPIEEAHTAVTRLVGSRKGRCRFLHTPVSPTPRREHREQRGPGRAVAPFLFVWVGLDKRGRERVHGGWAVCVGSLGER